MSLDLYDVFTQLICIFQVSNIIYHVFHQQLSLGTQRKSRQWEVSP